MERNGPNVRSFQELCDIVDQELNHSEHFVDPLTGAHTNSIESTWNHLKQKIPKQSYKRDVIESHLLTIIWKRVHKDNLWQSLINALATYNSDFLIVIIT